MSDANKALNEISPNSSHEPINWGLQNLEEISIAAKNEFQKKLSNSSFLVSCHESENFFSSVAFLSWDWISSDASTSTSRLDYMILLPPLLLLLFLLLLFMLLLLLLLLLLSSSSLLALETRLCFLSLPPLFADTVSLKNHLLLQLLKWDLWCCTLVTENISILLEFNWCLSLNILYFVNILH